MISRVNLTYITRLRISMVVINIISCFTIPTGINFYRNALLSTGNTTPIRYMIFQIIAQPSGLLDDDQMYKQTNHTTDALNNFTLGFTAVMTVGELVTIW